MNKVIKIANDKILEMIESTDELPWSKPWKTRGIAPYNPETGNKYNGINFWILSYEAEIRESFPLFVTFKGAKRMGGSVRKGASSIPVFYMNFILLDEDGKKTKDPEKAEKRIPYMRYYRVFHYSDVEGVEFDLPEEEELNEFERLEKAESLIPNSAEIIESEACSQASYSPKKDRINMPALGLFRSREEYYSTLFHELGHWTGHESRLGRFNKGERVPAFGSADYSKEELVAELTASYCLTISQIESEDATRQNAAYIQGWMKAIKNKPNLFLSASAKAQKAFDFIRKESQVEVTA